MALNRLRFHNILVQEMDAPSEAATELAEVVDEGIEQSKNDLATKHDLDLLRLEIIRQFNNHLRWLLAAGISIGGAIIGLLIALIIRGG